MTNEVAKRVVTDLDLCIACGSCAAACYFGHAGMPVVTFANPGPTRLPLICRQCKRPSCVDSCNFNAMIRDEETGVISRALFRCRGCGSCSRGCPFGLIPPELRFHRVPKCDLCEDRLPKGLVPRCVAACPSGALRFVDEREADELGLIELGGRTSGQHRFQRMRR